MTRYISILALLQILVSPGWANNELTDLKISNDGMISHSAASGSTTWTGKMTIENPRFHLVAKGTTSLFGGPAMRRTSGKEVSLKAATFHTETQWISLVVIGEISITVRNANKDSPAITAQRVVYVPSEDRLMIDGEPWLADQAAGSLKKSSSAKSPSSSAPDP